MLTGLRLHVLVQNYYNVKYNIQCSGDIQSIILLFYGHFTNYWNFKDYAKFQRDQLSGSFRGPFGFCTLLSNPTIIEIYFINSDTKLEQESKLYNTCVHNMPNTQQYVWLT